MSYDHLLYQAPPDSPPMSEWTHDMMVPWPSPAELRRALAAVAELRDNGTFGWLVRSTVADAEFDASPYPFEEGEPVQMLSLHGAWREDVVRLADALGCRAFDPQSGCEVYPITTLRILPDVGAVSPIVVSGRHELTIRTSDRRLRALRQWLRDVADGWRPASVSDGAFESEVEVRARPGVVLRIRDDQAFLTTGGGSYQQEIATPTLDFLFDTTDALLAVPTTEAQLDVHWLGRALRQIGRVADVDAIDLHDVTRTGRSTFRLTLTGAPGLETVIVKTLVQPRELDFYRRQGRYTTAPECLFADSDVQGHAVLILTDGGSSCAEPDGLSVEGAKRCMELLALLHGGWNHVTIAAVPERPLPPQLSAADRDHLLADGLVLAHRALTPEHVLAGPGHERYVGWSRSGRGPRAIDVAAILACITPKERGAWPMLVAHYTEQTSHYWPRPADVRLALPAAARANLWGTLPGPDWWRDALELLARDG